LLLSSCGPDKVVQHLPTPPDRLVCEAAGARPAIPAEHVINWNSVVTVPQARAEHEKYVATIRNREGIITGYIMRIEGKLFTCHTNMAWRRTFEAGLESGN
jgi:hypothetical protein